MKGVAMAKYVIKRDDNYRRLLFYVGANAPPEKVYYSAFKKTWYGWRCIENTFAASVLECRCKLRWALIDKRTLVF